VARKGEIVFFYFFFHNLLWHTLPKFQQAATAY